LRDGEVNPLEDILYSKKNQPNQPNQPNQFNDKLIRTNTSFHILPSIASGFRSYSKFQSKTVGGCVEAAFIEYMQNHPVDQVTLQVTKDMRSFIPSLSDKLKLKIIKNKLSKRLEVTIRLYQRGNEYDIQDNLEVFQKIIEKALRIKNPDPELTELLRKSEEYL